MTRTDRCRPGGLFASIGEFHDLIVAKLEQGLSGQRIFQDLVDEYGFAAKYHSVRRYVAKLKRTQPLPFRRIEVAAGEEAQIDFGTGAPVIDSEGRRRKTHVLRVVLSYSRKAYSEAVYRQTTDTGWGYTKIVQAMRRLGHRISRQTVKNILVEAGLGPDPSDHPDTSSDFLKRHAATMWQCDFASKRKWTIKGMVDLYFLVFIHVETRRIWISPCTANPTGE